MQTNKILRMLGCAATALALTPAAAAAGANTQPEPTPASVIDAESWVMVVIPDIQSYVDHSARTFILDQIIQWIIDNRDSCNIGLVLQEGDIVFQNGIPVGALGTGDQNSAEQWLNAQLAFHRLNGVVPYILVPGNHDYGISDAQNRSTQFDAYFKPTDNPLVDPDQDGILVEMGRNAAGHRTLENACYDFTAPDGRQLLIIGLEWGPRQAAVDWAAGIARRPEYAGHTKLLLTHAYLNHDNTRLDWLGKGIAQNYNPHSYPGTAADTNDGEELWNKLVRLNPGFELVLCGHIAGDMVGYLASPNDAGETVHQLLFNAQFLPIGGQGWIRLLEYLPDGETVHVRTFSPYFALDADAETTAWRSGPEDDFLMRFSPVDPPAGSSSAD